MGFLRETLIVTGWLKPRPGEFLPEHQDLGLAYQLFDLTFRDSRRELERKPEEEEMVRDLMGRRISERALRVTRAASSAANYTTHSMGPHYIAIDTSYLFSLKSQRLLIKPAPGIKIDLEQLEDARSPVWFQHGKTVVENTLRNLAEFHGLPVYLTKIEIPK